MADIHNQHHVPLDLRVAPDGSNDVFRADKNTVTAEKTLQILKNATPNNAESSSYLGLFVNAAGHLRSVDESGTVSNAEQPATTSNIGVIRMATSGEVTTGTATDRGVTPASLGPRGGASGFASLDGSALVPAAQLPTASAGDVTTGTSTTTVVTPASLGPKGGANGIATLDGAGLLPLSQIPSSIQNGMKYQGTWDASGGSAPSGSPNQGDVYKVTTAGSYNLGGETDWKVGDAAVYNGTSWDKWDNTEQVTSVAGKTGAITLAVADIVDMYTGGDLHLPSTTTPVMYVIDSTSRVGVNKAVPTAELHISANGSDDLINLDTSSENAFKVNSNGQVFRAADHSGEDLTRDTTGTVQAAAQTTLRTLSFGADGTYFVSVNFVGEDGTYKYCVDRMYHVTLASSTYTAVTARDTTINKNGRFNITTTAGGLLCRWDGDGASTVKYMLAIKAFGPAGTVSFA